MTIPYCLCGDKATSVSYSGGKECWVECMNAKCARGVRARSMYAALRMWRELNSVKPKKRTKKEKR